MVEPRGAGVALFTLRAAEEVRAAQFGIAEGEPDAEMVAIAKAIIAQRTSTMRSPNRLLSPTILAGSVANTAVTPVSAAARR